MSARRVTALAAAVAVAAALAGPGAAAAKPKSPGTVLDVKPLPMRLWIPEHTKRAFRLKYTTVGPFDTPAPSTGEVFVPKGNAPPGGWPVISWAHGTSGLADKCAPSRIGPALPARDFPYLSRWMGQGYAIVASDYVGLGTRGLHPYLDGMTTAHSVVDMVKAARNFAAKRLPRTQRLAREWVTVGQSQGGGGAIYTARHATELGGSKLDYRGAVGTGTPAYIENVVALPGPGAPPVALPSSVTEYLAYIYASLRYVHPELGMDGILTPTGDKYLDMAETLCGTEFGEQLGGVVVGDWFARPVASLPGFTETVRGYMGMPEDGFDRPFFMGHGLIDTDVPYATTALYVAALQANGEPLTFRTYPADHSGALIASQRDTIPFVRSLFSD